MTVTERLGAVRDATVSGSGSTGPQPHSGVVDHPVPEAEPVWLMSGASPIFAWVHRAPGSPAGSAVLCPPLLGENAAASHAYRMLARSLASAGVLAVRFDYEGTGDSGGSAVGSDRLDAWLRSVDCAVAEGRRWSDGPVALVGMRSGALIAAAAADRRGDVDALVLWDPWVCGRRFLRRQQALYALGSEGSEPTGGVEVPGFTLDAATSHAVGALRLPASLRARRVLVVTRRGAGNPVAGSAALGALEVLESAPEEEEMLFEVDAQRRRMPVATLSLACEWLRGATGSTPEPLHLTPRPAPSGRDPREPAAIVVEDGSVVYERPVWLGSGRLFGMETSPALGPDGFPTVVFLTSGANSHVGPNGLWVTLARRWAALGTRCVRVDLSGWGESEPRPGRPDLVMRDPAAFDDVEEVVEAVGGAGRVVLVGLCSGAYQALESALDVSPLAVLAVNPLLRFTPPELVEDGRMSPRRRLCEPRHPWVTSLRSVMPERVTGPLVALRRSTRRRLSHASASPLDELALAGVRVYCLCGEEEASALPPSGRHLGAAVATRVRVDVVPSLDHALIPAAHRRVAIERLTSAVGRITAELCPG